jgi:hypothetical protein
MTQRKRAAATAPIPKSPAYIISTDKNSHQHLLYGAAGMAQETLRSPHSHVIDINGEWSQFRLNFSQRDSERLFVNGSALDWHLHNCRGVFPLCPSAYFELANVQSELRVTNDKSASKVYQRMRFPTENLPEIYVVGEAR